MNASRPRSNPLVVVLVGAAVIAFSWLGVRQMGKKLAASASSNAPASPSESAPPNDGRPIVAPIPSEFLLDVGKATIARVDLVVRMDGVDVSLDGAPVCRSEGHTAIAGDPSRGAGSFDAAALDACFAKLDFTGKKPFATITRAGPAVPSEHLDALAAAVRRDGVGDLQVVP